MAAGLAAIEAESVDSHGKGKPKRAPRPRNEFGIWSTDHHGART
ncbi:hypothetical protein GGD63_007969 [Bradyrhizobium sp. cir1]|nr:hypothetical protein [Bradyrhizobium sp. cir1]MBB4375125.1 hypothetical protein [Bradyrhizobium sp. cir1]